MCYVKISIFISFWREGESVGEKEIERTNEQYHNCCSCLIITNEVVGVQVMKDDILLVDSDTTRKDVISEIEI